MGQGFGSIQAQVFPWSCWQMLKWTDPWGLLWMQTAGRGAWHWGLCSKQFTGLSASTWDPASSRNHTLLASPCVLHNLSMTLLPSLRSQCTESRGSMSNLNHLQNCLAVFHPVTAVWWPQKPLSAAFLWLLIPRVAQSGKTNPVPKWLLINHSQIWQVQQWISFPTLHYHGLEILAV